VTRTSGSICIRVVRRQPRFAIVRRNDNMQLLAGTQGLWRLPPPFLCSVSPAAVAVTVSLLIGGAKFADAATGERFILGKANREASTASPDRLRRHPASAVRPAREATADGEPERRGQEPERPVPGRSDRCWSLNYQPGVRIG